VAAVGSGSAKGRGNLHQRPCGPPRGSSCRGPHNRGASAAESARGPARARRRRRGYAHRCPGAAAPRAPQHQRGFKAGPSRSQRLGPTLVYSRKSPRSTAERGCLGTGIEVVGPQTGDPILVRGSRAVSRPERRQPGQFLNARTILAAVTRALRYLHLSDLHLGCPGRVRWWQVEEDFQRSLAATMARVGGGDRLGLSLRRVVQHQAPA
jgi:hypothetical protein